MKPLHTSYSNLSTWKATVDADGEGIRIDFDARRGIANAVAVFVGCLLGIIGLSHLDGMKERMPVAYVILGLTGLVTPIIIVASGIREKKKGPILLYRTKTDTLQLPRLDQTIESASQSVYFSSEHYSGGVHLYELNVVINGQRLPFISTNLRSNFKPVTKVIEGLGFAVNHQKIKV